MANLGWVMLGGLILYLGAEWLVKGAAGLARTFGTNEIVVGLTVIAYGTSAPELAVSLGAVESLIEQPLIMSYYECTPEERKTFGIPDNMIRMACGVENTDDLIADLKQALER